jgi:hypothetical protein
MAMIARWYLVCYHEAPMTLRGHRDFAAKRLSLWLYVSMFVSCTFIGAGCGEPGPSRSSRLFRVTVLGQKEVLAGLRTRGFQNIVPGASIGTADEATAFEAYVNDWSGTFSFARAVQGAPELVVAPWICGQCTDAEVAANAGDLVTENRIIELDADGRWWTNGRLGLGFPAECSWSLSQQQSGRFVIALQDGPSLCDEDTRKGTQVELLDSSNQVIAHPRVCSAVLSSRELNGVVSIALERDTESAGEQAFTLYLAHCLSDGPVSSFAITATEINASACPSERAGLLIGAVGSSKPSAFKLQNGQWNALTVSRERTGRHLSDIDLTFANAVGVTYRMRGRVDLPEVFE